MCSDRAGLGLDTGRAHGRHHGHPILVFSQDWIQGICVLDDLDSCQGSIDVVVDLQDPSGDVTQERKDVSRHLGQQGRPDHVVVILSGAVGDDGQERALQSTIFSRLAAQGVEHAVATEDGASEGPLALGALLNRGLVVELSHHDLNRGVVGGDSGANGLELRLELRLGRPKSLGLGVKALELLAQVLCAQERRM